MTSQTLKILSPGFLILSLLVAGCGGGSGSSTSLDGTYALVVNECEDDDGSVTIDQSGSDLTFNGGFSSGPSPYFGTAENETNVTFTNGDGDCAGTIVDGVFTGTCHHPTEDCSYEYNKE